MTWSLPPSLSGRTFVVTGGAGFIGSNLVEAILTGGGHVRVLDDFSTGRRSNLEHADAWAAQGNGSYRLVEGDIRDESTCREVVADADYVLHQAAAPSVPRSVEDPVGTHEVNALGTLRLLVAARDAGVRRFVAASSSSVYGESEQLPKEESMPPEPISPYGLQKLAAEKYLGLFHRLYGLPTVALRYFNVFGPRQDPNSQYAAVVPKFASALRDGRPATVYGDGEQSRDFTYVDNVVQANLRACEAPDDALGLAYNVGCGDRITIKRLVQEIASIGGVEARIENVDPRPGDIRHSLASIDRAGRLLGYEPTVGLRSGLERTLEAL